MILWKSKEAPETRGEEPGNTIDWPCSAFRRVLQASLNRAGFSLELVSQHKWKSTGEWQTGHVGNWGVVVNKHFALGEHHVYYDGPHCFFDLGFVHFQYVPKDFDCKKCMPADDSPCAKGECRHKYHQE